MRCGRLSRFASVAAACALVGACSRPSPSESPPDGAAPDAIAVRPTFQGPLVDGLARAESPDGRWGFVDAQGAWAVAPSFEWAESFSGGLAAARTKGRWGYVDRSGAFAVDATLLDADPFSEGLAAVRDEKGWRFVDAKGSTVLPGPFEAARPFACGAARVKLDRFYLVGRGEHGDYLDIMDSFGQHWRDAEFAAIEALGKGGSGVAPADAGTTSVASSPVRVTGAHVDEIALARLFEVESGTGMGGQWASVRGLKGESQWEDDTWVVVDRSGAIVPPALVKPCDADPERARVPPVGARAVADGGVEAPDAGGNPAELAKSIARLHLLRDRADVFLGFYTLGPAAVPPLVDALGSATQRTRLNALEILARMGSQASDASAAVAARLRDPQEVFYAAWVLGRMGPAAAPLAPALLEAYPRRPALVAAALEDIGDAAAPALTEALRDEHVNVAGAAAIALSRIDRDRAKDAGVQAALLRALGDAGFPGKALALRALPAEALAGDARPLLSKVAAEWDAEARDEALDALVRLHDPAVIGLLADRLTADTPHLGERDGRAIGDATATLDRLARFGRDAAPRAREKVKEAFGGSAGAGPAPDLSSLTDQVSCAYHTAAGRALAAFGGDDAMLIDDADQSLDAVTDEFSRPCDTSALRILFELGPRARAAVPHLRAYAGRRPRAAGATKVVLAAIEPAADAGGEAGG